MEVRSNGRKVRSSGMEVRSNGMQVAIRLHFCSQCPSIQNPPGTSSPRAQGLVNSGPVSGAFPRICCSTNVLPHFLSAFFASSILFFVLFHLYYYFLWDQHVRTLEFPLNLTHIHTTKTKATRASFIFPAATVESQLRSQFFRSVQERNYCVQEIFRATIPGRSSD